MIDYIPFTVDGHFSACLNWKALQRRERNGREPCFNSDAGDSESVQLNVLLTFSLLSLRLA
jgi:hypothetical protein